MATLEFDAPARRSAANLIDLALFEDLAEGGDLTGLATIPAGARGSAVFRTRSEGVIAGLPVLAMVIDRFNLTKGFETLIADGASVQPGDTIARVRGSMHALLSMERTALNFVQRLSGIATKTARFVAAVAGTRAQILDTRKTTPGWRMLEKYAVRAGGGTNHRLGLFDGILIKDNHLAWLASSPDSIGAAIQKARDKVGQGVTIEIEVDSLVQFEQALDCRPDIILLDNFLLGHLDEAVRRRDARAPSVKLEASGGVTLETVGAIARTGVDRISVGALTHSARALDIGLDFEGPEPT